MNLRRTIFLSIVCAAFLCPSTTIAGNVVVQNADLNSTVRVFAEDANGDTIDTQAATVKDATKPVEFGLSPEVQKKTTSVFVCKDNQGRRIWFRLRFTTGMTTLALAEPFQVPTFADAASAAALVADVNVSALSSVTPFVGAPFTVGQSVPVTNGSIPQTSAITFKNGSSLGSPPGDLNQLRDPNAFAALPNFSGTAQVVSYDDFLMPGGIPTLSEWGLLTLVVLMLLSGVYLVVRRRHAVR